jgi:gliding motility-associated-like protein
MKFLWVFTLLFSLLSSSLYSQEFITVGNAFGIPVIQGDACLEADTCFTLTEDLNSQAGAVWDLDVIDLTASFDATFCLFLGVNDVNGADGFAFVMRAPGTSGAPASDIPDDHTGLFYNGDNSNPIAAVVPLLGEGINAEDGAYHTTRIVWNAFTFELEMYFDDVLLISSQDNLINSVFGGNPEVIWGFTSSTGGAANLQQICFPTVSIDISNYFACDGDTVSFSYFTQGITSYQWTDEENNLLVDWNIDDGTELTDTLLTATESGVFYLDFEFNNNLISDSVVVTFIENPEQPFAENFLELCPETDYPFFLNALNDGGSYEWQNGEDEQFIELVESGWYSVLIAEPILSCASTDSIEISHFCEPRVVFPNVFTPNADSLNSFFVPAVFNYIGEFDFKLFNRWGAEVYSTTTRIKWNGDDSNSNPLPDGTYFYTCYYAGLKGEQTGELNGTVTIFRD